MRIPLTVNNANKISVMLSLFSKMMVNVRNVVNILNLKITILLVKLRNLHAMLLVNI
jgi:hypothetical protein